MNNLWTIGNIIDLEYALKQDVVCSDEKVLKKRDRQIFFKHVRPCLMQQQGEDNIDLSDLFRAGASLRSKVMAVWLERIKADPIEQHDKEWGVFPGTLYEEVLSLMRIIFFLAGASVGFSLCLSFFSYTGQHPLNISYFLALTLFPQLALLLFFSGFYLILKLKLIDQSSFVPYPFLYTAVEKLFMFLNRSLLTKISRHQLSAIDTALGIVRQEQQVYGLVFFWPLFLVMQLFGIAFNGAVLLSILFRVFFFDTAFGWQSTLQVGADAVEKLVTLVALPWSWIQSSGFAVPELEHIVGSRMILKDGIYRLATEDLVSWWPFLCMAVAVYGFLPRAILFLTGRVALKRSLEQLTFDHGSCSRVIRRMFTPYVVTNGAKNSTEAEGYGLKAKNGNGNGNETEYAADSYEYSGIFPPFIALVPEDLHEFMDEAHFMNLMESVHRCHIIDIIQTGMDFDLALEHIKNACSYQIGTNRPYIKVENSQDITTDRRGIGTDRADIGTDRRGIGTDRADIGTDRRGIGTDRQYIETDRHYDDFHEKSGDNRKQGILFLQEAWQPPITETLSFIKSVRKCAGQKTPLMVALVGKPQPGTLFTPVGETDWEIWKMKLATLGDPWLSMEKIIVE